VDHKAGSAQVRPLGADVLTMAHVPGDAVPHVVSAQQPTEDLERLLRSYPRAAVSAVSESGFFAPMPATVPLTAHTVLRGHRSALELVAADDLRSVIGAWQDAFNRGYASATVRLLDPRDTSVTIHYLDARAEHGVFLCLIVGDLDHLTGLRGDAGIMRPRVSIVRKDGQAVFTAVDEAAVTLLGRHDLVGCRNVDLIHPDDAPLAIATWMDMLASPGQTRRARLRQQHADGTWIWFEVTNHNLLNDPTERCVVAEMVDISDEMAAHEFVRAQEHLLRRLTDSLPVGVAQADADGLIVHRNQRLTAIVGRPDATTLTQLFDSASATHQAAFADAVTDALSGHDSDLEIDIDDIHIDAGAGDQSEDDALRRCHLTLRALDDGHGVIVCVDDITDRARLRDELHHRATFDALTNCHNRAATLHAVQQELDALAAGRHPGVTVVFIDLDGFKSVNDRHGHAAGDARLRDVARCLRAAAHGRDIVGRLGGDEFLVLSTTPASPDQATAMAARLADALADAIPPSHGHRAAASIGLTWTSRNEPPPTPTADDLINAADTAMYQSKANGDGRPIHTNPATSPTTATPPHARRSPR
jgi:diguanylate cyclase (GGDEF)-like protein